MKVRLNYCDVSHCDDVQKKPKSLLYPGGTGRGNLFGPSKFWYDNKANVFNIMDSSQHNNFLINIFVTKWYVKEHFLKLNAIPFKSCRQSEFTCFLAVFLIFPHLAVFLTVTQPLERDAEVVVALKLVLLTALLTAFL